MSDDWSLKDKQFMVDDGYALLSLHKVDKGGLYSSEDIETLRKELIRACFDVFEERGRTISGHTFKRIINKKFGIEE